MMCRIFSKVNRLLFALMFLFAACAPLSSTLLQAAESDKPNIVLVYMGNDVWGVKWRNWKINLKEQNNIVSETHSYGMPRIYNLHKDLGETQNVLCSRRPGCRRPPWGSWGRT
jgi:hypothetical protein